MGGLRLDGIEEAGNAHPEASFLVGAFAYTGIHTLDIRAKKDDEPRAERIAYGTAPVGKKSRAQ